MSFSSRTKVLSVVAAVAIPAFGVTACGSSSDSVPRNEAGEIVVDFWHSSSGAAGETLQGIVDQFNKEHEGEYEIHASYQGAYEDSISKFIASVQTGHLPALMQASDIQSRFMMDSGLAIPAEDLAKENDDYDFNDLVPVVANYYTMGDKIYSMPAMVSQPVLYVNDKALADAGIKPSSLSTTEGLMEAVEKLHGKTGRSGLTFHHSGWFVEEMAAMLGNEFCTPENGITSEKASTFRIDDPQLVDMWTKISELYKKDAIHDAGSDGSAATGAFLSQNAAIQLNSSGGYGNVAEANLDWDWSIHALPRDTDAAGAVPGGNSLWAIEEGTSKEEQTAAWEFMKFVGSDEVQKKIFDETGYLPTTTSAMDSLTDLGPQQKSLLEQYVSTPVNTVTAGCHTGALNDARKSYGQAMSAIANGKDPRTEFETAQETADSAIASYNKRASK